LGWISHQKWFGVHREIRFLLSLSLSLLEFLQVGFFKLKRMGELVKGKEGGERGIMWGNARGVGHYPQPWVGEL